MYLSGLTHRERLFDIASRWLADHVQSEDGRLITEIFTFERVITAPSVRCLVADVWRASGAEDLYLERVDCKDAVREAIFSAAAHPSDRVAELLDWYRQLPEEFFPRTPVQMSIVTHRTGNLAALVRRKLIRRITDKVCRKVARRLGSEAAALARTLASTGPRTSNATANLDDAPGDMPRGVPGAAERLVAERIRSGRLVLDPENHRVDDVIGVKFIGTPAELERIDTALRGLDYARTHTREVHSGRYAGTHYLVDVELPPKGEIIDSLADVDWSFAAGRGLREEDLPSSFRAYLESGADSFRIEVILTTFDDLVESEFGESIHEQMILDQRFRASDYGRIANNGAWIIEYLLSLAVSPTVEVGELPIKLWGRYIRDTVYYAIERLHGVEPVPWPIPDEARTRGTVLLPVSESRGGTPVT